MKHIVEKFLIFVLLLITINCRYCGDGLIPEISTDCTNLSTIAYNCCMVQIASSTGVLPLCYPVPIKKAYFPNSMSYNTIPALSIVDLACEQPIEDAIKYENFCGIDNPKNSTICQVSGGENCCMFKYGVFNFCLLKDSYSNAKYEYSYDCSKGWVTISIFTFISYIFIFN